MEHNRPYQVTRSETHQIGRLTVVKDTILIGGKEHPYTYVAYGDSVCVLPIYQGKVIAIEQYRHTLNSWELELPCGGIERGETPENAARRELAEETGCIAGELVYLGKYYTNQGYSNAACSVYFTLCIGRGPTQTEETELIRLCEIPVPDLQEMAEDGRFRLLIGLAAWYQAKRHGLLNAQGGES